MDDAGELAPCFLARLGVDVVTSDYADLSGDLRRWARITGTMAAPDYDGEIFGSGCPDQIRADIFVPVNGGTPVTHYVHGNSTADCGDDQSLPTDTQAIRQSMAGASCAKSVAFAAPVVRTHDLNCADPCLFEDRKLGGATAHLVADLFAWAGRPIGAPIGIEDTPATSPRVTRLLGVGPNPAHPRATIRFTLAGRAPVRLRSAQKLVVLE